MADPRPNGTGTGTGLGLSTTYPFAGTLTHACNISGPTNIPPDAPDEAA